MKSTLNSHGQVLSHDELMISGGRDYIGEACAVFALIAYSSGGSIVANPVGGAVAGFCVGYTLGSVIAGWLS
jgi:hypothetical protein